MNRATDTAGPLARAALPPAAPATAAAKAETPDLDLDRLVWDPEYRAAMRPLLQRGG